MNATREARGHLRAAHVVWHDLARWATHHALRGQALLRRRALRRRRALLLGQALLRRFSRGRAGASHGGCLQAREEAREISH